MLAISCEKSANLLGFSSQKTAFSNIDDNFILASPSVEKNRRVPGDLRRYGSHVT